MGMSQRGPVRHADEVGELEQPVHDVPFAACGKLRVREQPLLIASARAVEADPQRRADEQAHEVGARRRVHVQQRIETPSAERLAHVAVAPQAASLVEHEELDAVRGR